MPSSNNCEWGQGCSDPATAGSKRCSKHEQQVQKAVKTFDIMKLLGLLDQRQSH